MWFPTIHKVLLVSVISTLALYVMVTLLSVTAYPEGYDSWLSYIRDLDSLEGIEALPAFYAANRYLGVFGTAMLTLSLLALVITSLIGNISALSRLFYSMAKDRILPEKISEINSKGIPSRAVILVVAISALVPFVGRTAIGWIVDVTTIGATLIYGFVSAAAARLAREMGDSRERWTGIAGLLLMIGFGVYLILPNIVSKGTMAAETYFLFIVWSVLGFLFFRFILRHDKEKRFGASVSVWVALLSLVLMVSLIWMRQSMILSSEKMENNIRSYYAEGDGSEGQRRDDELYIERQMEERESENARTIMMAVGMFGFALIIMLTNHSYLNKRSRESELLANTDSMTGARNKHAYMVREKEINAAIAEKRARDFSVVVCDVNGLKKINDTLGHKAGDEYICSAFAMIGEIFAHSPVYRIGGDEFLVILQGRDHAVRHELMERLHNTSAEHITAGGAVVSGGLSDYDPEADSDLHAAFGRADQLMYEEINRLMLGNILQADYELIYASDGREALEILRESKDMLALVLLDLNLVGMGGRELLGIIKKDSELSLIPVIIMTADTKSEVECLRLGAADFIIKPYPMPEVIIARVNRCIELSEDRSMIKATERDSLTNLFNFDYFIRYVELFDQHYEDKQMDALVIEVSRFHMINERYGRQYGEDILRKIGAQIRQLARKISGVGCRSGADTFYIYCPHTDDHQELFDKISSALGKGDSGRVKLRMGVYADVDKSLDIELRFDRAKRAADTLKNSYRRQIAVYDAEMRERAMFRERLLEEFRPSLTAGQFKVYFQPKFDIRPDAPLLCGAEALVRWEHPELGILQPSSFIPLFEENGLILDLDRFVWEHTAAQIRVWKDKYGICVPVSVNVSRIDLLVPELKDIFKGILDKYGLSTEDIRLEITESAYTGNSDQVISAAKMLHGAEPGFRIEMDDFGMGYSSLGMLSKLPIDTLKMDMAFVRDAFDGEGSKDTRMIELIIDIAEHLEIPVVAEGVETQEQLGMLKKLGCDIVQGYYFSKPVPAEAFGRFIEERRERA